MKVEKHQWVLKQVPRQARYYRCRKCGDLKLRAPGYVQPPCRGARGKALPPKFINSGF